MITHNNSQNIPNVNTQQTKINNNDHTTKIKNNIEHNKNNNQIDISNNNLPIIKTNNIPTINHNKETSTYDKSWLSSNAIVNRFNANMMGEHNMLESLNTPDSGIHTNVTESMVDIYANYHRSNIFSTSIA